MSEKGSFKNGQIVALAVILVSMQAVQTTAQTTGDGTGGGDVGHLVQITVPDSAVTPFSQFTPTSGSETTKYSTSDFLQYSNGDSNLQTLWNFASAVSFVRDSDGSTITTSVSYQGTASTLTDLVYLSQASSNSFSPWKLVTGTDLTSETTGWTKHADCGTVTYQGSISAPRYSSSGSAESTQTYYYQVCDTSTELYVGAAKDLSAGDKAIIYTQPSAGSSATSANYVVTINTNAYVFYSAASATTVTLRQGMFVDLGTSANTGNLYFLLKFPDGFPAGVFSTTVTGTVTDIVS